MARKAKNLQWGSANRPKISNKLGIPHASEGSDGDIQIRQTNLGAKLFGKIGGRWSSTFLSSEDEIIGTSGTKIGMDSSGALNVDQIKLTGKVALTSTGSQNVCIGIDNADVSGSTNNVLLGISSGKSLISGSTANVCIGVQAGEDITEGQSNVCIGFQAGIDLTGVGSGNTCIGTYAGGTIQTGVGGLYLGVRAVASASNVNKEGVLAVGSLASNTVGRGTETLVLGHQALDDIYMNYDGSARVLLGHINFLERSSDPAEPAEGHAVVWMSDGTGKGADGDIMVASQAGGNTYFNTLFDHSASSSNTW